MAALVLAALFFTSVKGQPDFAVTAAPEGFAIKRGITNCDQGMGVFMCDRGTCYWGDDGFVGCCSVSSCAPRTTCIEYADLDDNPDCDHNTGGCVVCSNSNSPYCFTNTNIAMSQYGMYCAAVRSVVTHTSTYTLPEEAKSPEEVSVTTASEEEEITTESAFTSSPRSSSTLTTNPSRITAATTSELDSSAFDDSEETDTSDTGSVGIAGVPRTSTSSVGSANAGTSTSSSEPSPVGINTGAIVGGVLGGVGGITIIAVGAVWFLLRQHRQKRQEQSNLSTQAVAYTQPSTATMTSFPPSYNPYNPYGSQSLTRHTQISPEAPSFGGTGSSVVGYPNSPVLELSGDGRHSGLVELPRSRY